MSNILLVEDTQDVGRVLSMALEAEQHQVKVVATCQAARPIIAAGRLDLLITDVLLPDGDAMPLVEDAEQRGIPCLLITGDVTTALQINNAGRKCLAKPFPLTAFVDEVEAVLGAGRSA
ncbi:MAG TPA: response regulator [Rhodopila sp.]|nr:response regulator [Rhodopila sp.]